MIQLRKSAERGHADHGWLQTWHSFSFADYHDPRYMGFSVLRVLNQDQIEPKQGFGAHHHRDMEIVTWVLSGALEHRDSLGNGSVIRPGDAQLMSAGSGIMHSEYNASVEEPLELLQMWVLPAQRGGKPSYQQRHFPEVERQGRLARIVAPAQQVGDVGPALRIAQDVSLYAGGLAPEQRSELQLGPKRAAWVHLAHGRVLLNGQLLGPGDGAAVEGETHLSFECLEPADLVVFDLPPHTSDL